MASVAAALKVGLALPIYEGMFGGRTARWADLLAPARQAEAAGFDSVWLFDHLLIPVDRYVPGAAPMGAWECWSLLAALAAATERVTLGTLMTCTAFRNPALLAKMADTVDEISGGRLILGLGAGSIGDEFGMFGYPEDHRASRFAEALQIIGGLLRDGRVDFAGRYYQARECELRPRGPRRAGPPILVGARQARLDRLAARHADAWNAAWPSRAAALAPRVAAIKDACRAVGRDPATLELTAGVMVDLPGLGPRADWAWGGLIRGQALSGTVEEIAAELHDCACLGVAHLQVWLDPATPAGVEAFAPVLQHLKHD